MLHNIARGIVLSKNRMRSRERLSNIVAHANFLPRKHLLAKKRVDKLLVSRKIGKITLLKKFLPIEPSHFVIMLSALGVRRFSFGNQRIYIHIVHNIPKLIMNAICHVFKLVSRPALGMILIDGLLFFIFLHPFGMFCVKFFSKFLRKSAPRVSCLTLTIRKFPKYRFMILDKIPKVRQLVIIRPHDLLVRAFFFKKPPRIHMHLFFLKKHIEAIGNNKPRCRGLDKKFEVKSVSINKLLRSCSCFCDLLPYTLQFFSALFATRFYSSFLFRIISKTTARTGNFSTSLRKRPFRKHTHCL